VIEKRGVGILIDPHGGSVSTVDLSRTSSFAEEVRRNREKWERKCHEIARDTLDWTKEIEGLISAYDVLANEQARIGRRRTA
jgi:hypothetical protein